jgi:hypothetical protein
MTTMRPGNGNQDRPMQIEIPAVLYRGGTSKGPLFLAIDLPADQATRDAVLLAAMGSPHPRQIDGLGGADSLTSKVAIVSRSKRPGIDVDYLFAQVTPDSDLVDYFSNCGNMLSAVGPFAIEQGLVAATGGETIVRIFNVNSNAPIDALMQTPGGRVTYEGAAAIDGVNGTAAPVRLNFAQSAGSTTGKLLPTDMRRRCRRRRWLMRGGSLAWRCNRRCVDAASAVRSWNGCWPMRVRMAASLRGATAVWVRCRFTGATGLPRRRLTMLRTMQGSGFA